jgi:ribonuclease BN (tRNA processing enzyme)
MRLKFLGSGDAFGSGGRLNACFFVPRGEESFLIDCGATALVSIRRFGVDPNSISSIFVSHLHVDHFGGVPTFIIDAQVVSRRRRPLRVVGPIGIKARLDMAMESAYAGSTKIRRQFEVEVTELRPDEPTAVGDVSVQGYPGVHPSGGDHSLALRLNVDGKTIAYSGDTQWVDNLIDASREADLFVCESYFFEKAIRFHLSYADLRERLSLITARRIVLTHMSADMLSRIAEVALPCAFDGMEVEF